MWGSDKKTGDILRYFVKNSEVTTELSSLDNGSDDDLDEETYKRAYFALIREISKTVNDLEYRCPLVKSCCGACTLLKIKIRKIKNFDPIKIKNGKQNK